MSELPPDIRFSGHESFVCRYAWLPKAVRRVSSNKTPWSDLGEAMADMGLGKNMVISLRFWAEAAGVVRAVGQEWKVTDFGDRIFGPDGLDRYLDDVATLWLLHWNIASAAHAAPLFAWHCFFNQWLDVEFTRGRALEQLARTARIGGRTVSDGTLAQHVDIFLHTYASQATRRGTVAEESLDSPLIELGLVQLAGESTRSKIVGESAYLFPRSARPGISPALFSYCIADYWTRRRSHEKTLTFSDVASAEGSVGNIFRLSESDLRMRLESIAEDTQGMFEYQYANTTPRLVASIPLEKMDVLESIYRAHERGPGRVNATHLRDGAGTVSTPLRKVRKLNRSARPRRK